MSPPATAESVINRVERRSPHVVELAELLGPAVRIEAALVRRLRIDLLPHLPAAVEAELWFSPLVQAHSVDGIALSVPIAVAFRERLTRQWETGRRALLEQARTIYADVHAYLPPPLRLEEEVAWSLVAGDAEAVDAQLETAVAALLAEPDRFRFWAGQAKARLPDGVSMTTSGVRLTRAATGGELSGPGWEAAYRALATRPLAVRHIGPQLELGGPAGPGCRSIAVPGTAEVLLQLHWPSVSGGATERVTVDPRDDAPTQILGSGHVEVRTAAGVSYVVRDDPFERSCRVDPAADPRGELRSILRHSSVPGLRLAEEGEAAEMGMVLLDGRAALVHASGRPFPAVPRLDPRDDSFAAHAAAMAAHVSRWLTIAELRSGSPLLAGAIEVTVAGAGTERGQNIDLTATDLATVTIANFGTGPLFVAVLALPSDWSVDVVIWDGGSSGLPPGDRWESVLRLNILGPEQNEGFVRLIGVAAHHPFDPLPLALPPISQASPSMPAPYASSLGTKTPSIPTLDTEFAIMAGVPVASPVPRYLEWTNSEALVRVRWPNVPLPEGIDKIAIPPEPPDVPGVLERLRAIQRTFREPLATAEPTDLNKALADLKQDGRDGLVCFNHLYRVITAEINKEIKSGSFFRTNDFITQFDVIFADRYLDAIRRYTDPEKYGPAPECWRILFEYREDREISPMQFAICGVTCHVLFDLPIAVVQVCKEMGESLDDYTRSDFLKVNDIFNETIPKLREYYKDQSERKFDRSIVTRLANHISDFIVVQSHDSAWKHATELWDVWDSPDDQREKKVNHLDNRASYSGRGILRGLFSGTE